MVVPELMAEVDTMLEKVMAGHHPRGDPTHLPAMPGTDLLGHFACQEARGHDKVELGTILFSCSAFACQCAVLTSELLCCQAVGRDDGGSTAELAAPTEPLHRRAGRAVPRRFRLGVVRSASNSQCRLCCETALQCKCLGCQRQ
eukprot:1375091-Rhodomonas_salina.3